MAHIAKNIQIDDLTRQRLGAGDGNLYMKCLSIGQGDCTFIICPNGTRMMIDCGSRKKDDIGQIDRVVTELPRDGENLPVNVVVMTHSDGDHYNKFGVVIGSGPIGIMYYSGDLPKYKSLEFRQWVYGSGPYSERAAVIASCTPITVNVVGTPPVNILDGGGGAMLSVIAANVEPAGDPTSAYAINTRSVVVRGTYNGSSFIIGADATCTTEAFMFANRATSPLACSFLRVPHHGSTTSSSTQFINETSPGTAVISAAGRNRYGLPRKSVVDRYLAKVASGDAHDLSYYVDPGGEECEGGVEDAIRPTAVPGTDEMELGLENETISTTQKLYNTGTSGTYLFTIPGPGSPEEPEEE